MALSPPSSPSEGEIVESDLEKATTALVSNNGTSVDRPFRKRISVSRSPSPIRSPRRKRSRTESRSPYRENRGAKRLPLDDHYDRSQDDPRRFKVRYEDRPGGGRLRGSDHHYDTDLSNRGLGHDYRDTNGRPRSTRPRIRSRSPDNSRTQHSNHERRREKSRSRQGYRDYWLQSGKGGHNESQSKLSKEQSVSDRGHSSVAAAQLKRHAESQIYQTQHLDDSVEKPSSTIAKYGPLYPCGEMTDWVPKSSGLGGSPVETEASQLQETQPLDEAALIEERRKKRKAIKAKHRGQSTPMLVQALALDSKSAPSTPRSLVIEDGVQASSKSR